MSEQDGRLAGRRVLVPGGTGNVGEGVVRSLLTQRAVVVVPSRSAQRLADLGELVGPELVENLVGLEASYDSFEAADELVDTVFADGGVTDVVALVGGWWAGNALSQISAEDWQQVFVSPATTHMALVRAFLPRLGHGSYTTIAGFSSYTAEPGSGPVSMQGAAQLMMRRTLSKEVDDGPRVNDLMLGPVITRSRPQGKRDWLNADEVGQVVAKVIADPTIDGRTVDVQRRPNFEFFLGA